MAHDDAVIPFNEDDVRGFLDGAIRSWRDVRDSEEEGTEPHLMARCYVDAFQSVRVSLFGEVLP